MRTIKKGATSQSLYFEVLDSASTSGGRKTGLAYNTSSLTAYYVRNGASSTAITLATLAAANSAWSSGGFKEVDATNMPGVYRLDVPDAAFASGADSVVVTIKGASGMVQASYDVQLVDNTAADIYSRLGAPAGASVSADIAAVKTDTAAVKLKTDSLNFTVSGQVDANVTNWKGSAAPAMTGDAYARIGAAGAGLTALGDTRIANLDAAVSTRSTYAGADTSGTTTLLSRLTSTRAGLLDHLDADISSRMATFSYTAPDNASITAIKAKTDNLPSDPASDSNVFFAASEVMSHGDAAWLTASGFSTSADITGAVSTLEGYGDTHWATATGFSTLSAADVEAAVLDAAINDHLTDGTVGKEIYNAATYAGSADSKADTTLTNIAALNDLSAADVNAQADQALADAGVTTVRMGHLDADVSSRLAASSYTAPDDTAVLAAIAGLNDLSAADVNAEVDTAIADAALATAASLATTDGKVDAVKGKTDQLGFSGSLVNANVAAVNGVTVTGNGTTGNEWGPA